MFDNIGGKIKGLAQVSCWIGIIGSVVSGIVLMVEDDDLIVIGLLVMIVGALFSWIGSFLLYGFGELIERTTEVADNVRGIQRLLPKETNVVANKHTKDKNTCPKCGMPISEQPCLYCEGEDKGSKESEKQVQTTAENIARQHGW